MDPILLTVLIGSAIGVAFLAVVIKMIVDKRRGRSSCSCGGNCGACGLCHTDKK